MQKQIFEETPLSVHSVTQTLTEKISFFIKSELKFEPILVHGILVRNDRSYYIEDSQIQQSRVYLDAYRFSGHLSEHTGRAVVLRVIPVIEEFRGKFDIKFRVTEFVDAGEVSRITSEIDPYLIKTPRKPFPEKESYTVDVICPGSSDRTWCDLIGGLDKAVDGKVYTDEMTLTISGIPVTLRRLRTNMLSAADIAESITRSQADVVVIARGGGDGSEFGVFSDTAVIKAWAEKQAYRISAIGHSDNVTHLDVVSDTYCKVPLEAGVEIARCIEDIGKKKRYAESDKEIVKLNLKIEELTRKALETEQNYVRKLKMTRYYLAGAIATTTLFAILLLLK